MGGLPWLWAIPVNRSGLLRPLSSSSLQQPGCILSGVIKSTSCVLAAVVVAALSLISEAFSQADSSHVFAAADAAVQEAVDRGSIPGAVLVVGHAGKMVHRRAFGSRALEPRAEAMTADTIFDIASLTKPFTATCVMRLVERGQVRLNDPVVRYLPEFARNGKQEITVRQLLTHFSGLAPDLDLKASWSGYAHALQLAYDAEPVIPPGSGFLYSDINYIVLGELVAHVSGISLRCAVDGGFVWIRPDIVA